MTALITDELVVLDAEAADRHAVTRALAERLLGAGRVSDLDGFLADVRAREEQTPTGLPDGIGIPHARSAHVSTATLGFARVPGGVDFGAEDGPATLVFLIAAPASGGPEHLTILAALARRLVHQSFRDSLLQAADAQEVVEIITREVAQ
jgi:fructose-specific phosphotransferase system IIA component